MTWRWWLFQSLIIFAVGGSFGDSCGLRSSAPFGAGGSLPDPVLNPGEPQTDPLVTEGDANLRSARGGSHSNPLCRSSKRIGFMAGGRNTFIGCRVVVEWEPPAC